MKIALISDTHWGIRGDNPRFLNYFDRFYTDVFFPYLKAHEIYKVVHLGDLSDRRKYMNINTANRMAKVFFDPMREEQIGYEQIIGNHDAYFKNTNLINSFDMVNRWGLRSYTTATEVMLGGRKVLFVPWICDDNRAETMELIASTDALTAFGHFEFSGFQMYKGVEAHGAFDPQDVSKFDLVASGHFHTRSRKGNIQYLGAACEYTWSDHDDPRGFNIWDSETNEIEFVQNPITIFKKVFYDDLETKTWPDVTFANLKDSIVKVVVKNKSEPYLFDQFMDRLEKADPIEFQVVDDHKNQDEEDDSDIVSEAESTVDIFMGYIDQVDTGALNKDNLKKHMMGLYDEALEVMG